MCDATKSTVVYRQALGESRHHVGDVYEENGSEQHRLIAEAVGTDDTIGVDDTAHPNEVILGLWQPIDTDYYVIDRVELNPKSKRWGYHRRYICANGDCVRKTFRDMTGL